MRLLETIAACFVTFDQMLNISMVLSSFKVSTEKRSVG